MSGGVDSSVAACLLAERGYDVVGLFMRVGAPNTGADAARESPAGQFAGEERINAGPTRSRQGCCSASDASDARFVAGKLGIPFYALNFQQDFDQIIDYFADEYVRGRTPNPCVVCNNRLKFGRIVEYADTVGAKYIATGHYARVRRTRGINGAGDREIEARCGESDESVAGYDWPRASSGRFRTLLMRGRDRLKDQSYVLFGLQPAILDRVLFPIGEYTKYEVRAQAARFDLPIRDKPDSVEICFVPDRDYARLVRERRPGAFAEGPVLTADGRALGSHRGIGNYTIGQRRGLGIAAGEPVYVTDLNVQTNTVTVGRADELLNAALVADKANYLVGPPSDAFRAEVKIRYLHTAAPATVFPLEDDASRNRRVRVVFDEPQRAITPGQAVVFYHGEVVIGGAWIDHAERIGSGPR